MVRSCQRIRAHTFVTTPIFPTEVCEMIIDKVGDDIFEPCSQSQWSQPRAKALSSCALVAPSWLPRSRVHLFRDVCLSSEWRTERFIEALIHSPSLGKHVYTLRIKPDTVEDSQKWIHRILLYLPRLLPHLYHLQFFNLPVLHRSFVVLASRFTSVESLELSGLQAQSFGEIIQLINRYPHLDRLSIVDCKWRIPSRYLSRKQHEITKLTLRNDPDYQKEALNWVLASRSTLTLRVFCSISKLSSHGLEEQVLRTCLSTFQEMAIVGSITEQGSLLTTQHALKRLTLVCDCEEAVSAMSQLSCFELTLLEDICLKLAAGSTMCKLFDECKKASWKDINRALCGDKFTRFRSLVISSTETISRGDLHDVFKNPLPESYRCGKLWFSDGINHVLIAPESTSRNREIPPRWDIELF